MFKVKNLTKQYGEEFALRDVTLSIGKGMNFITGASGSGKTTLLKILCGMEPDFEGSVSYCGRDIAAFSSKEKSSLYHAVFGFVWQDFHLLEEATVLENVLLPYYLKDKKSADNAERILKQLKMEDLRSQKVKYLSGGQKQRVAIARELMKNPQVIFCDEPTSALDAKSARTIMDILRALSKNRTVIVVTHDTTLITPRDSVFELDKGELPASLKEPAGGDAVCKIPQAPKLSFSNACRIALINVKNRWGRFAVSVLSLVIAGTLLLTTLSGAIGGSGKSEFDKLLATYGESLLDLGLVGSFTNASGTGGGKDDKPNGDVEQDLGGLYEKYQNDSRVEFMVSMQAFENIKVAINGETHSIEKTGNSPVLAKLLSGSIPAGEENQVVVPVNFVKSLGLTPESALGKTIDFFAMVYQWVNNQPVEKPVRLQAVICGVADNTVVYEYQGQTNSFSVDDSFFFNRAANEEIRRQAGIEKTSGNFTMRAKTPEDLISLKDELNRSGIVPIGQFELVEDIVRLNRQTTEQSGSAGAVVGVLAVLLVLAVFAMTSLLRKREYAIYKISGYHNGHLSKIAAAETAAAMACAVLLLLAASPVLNMGTMALFHASILSVGKLAVGALLILGLSAAAFAAGLPAYATSAAAAVLKAGDRQ